MRPVAAWSIATCACSAAAGTLLLAFLADTVDANGRTILLLGTLLTVGALGSAVGLTGALHIHLRNARASAMMGLLLSATFLAAGAALGFLAVRYALPLVLGLALAGGARGRVLGVAALASGVGALVIELAAQGAEGPVHVVAAALALAAVAGGARLLLDASPRERGSRAAASAAALGLVLAGITAGAFAFLSTPPI